MRVQATRCSPGKPVKRAATRALSAIVLFPHDLSHAGRGPGMHADTRGLLGPRQFVSRRASLRHFRQSGCVWNLPRRHSRSMQMKDITAVRPSQIASGPRATMGFAGSAGVASASADGKAEVAVGAGLWPRGDERAGALVAPDGATDPATLPAAAVLDAAVRAGTAGRGGRTSASLVAGAVRAESDAPVRSAGVPGTTTLATVDSGTVA